MTARSFACVRPLVDVRFIIGLVLLASATAYDARADLGAPATATLYGAQVAAIPSAGAEFSRQIGRPHNINELARRMLDVIQAWSMYDADVGLPEVRAMPLEDMQLKLCGRPCTIRAAYVPGEGLYYDAALKPLTNRYHQSILFHELVHHVQVKNGSHAEFEECYRWGKREAEAYALQNRFLFSLGLSSGVLDPGKICAPV